MFHSVFTTVQTCKLFHIQHCVSFCFEYAVDELKHRWNSSAFLLVCKCHQWTTSIMVINWLLMNGPRLSWSSTDCWCKRHHSLSTSCQSWQTTTTDRLCLCVCLCVCCEWLLTRRRSVLMVGGSRSRTSAAANTKNAMTMRNRPLMNPDSISTRS